MKVLAPVKRVIDYNVRVRVTADQSGVELVNVKMARLTFYGVPGKILGRIRQFFLF